MPPKTPDFPIRVDCPAVPRAASQDGGGRYRFHRDEPRGLPAPGSGAREDAAGRPPAARGGLPSAFLEPPAGRLGPWVRGRLPETILKADSALLAPPEAGSRPSPRGSGRTRSAAR